MERMNHPTLATILKRQFPWLGTEQDAGSGADVIDQLISLYDEVSDPTFALHADGSIEAGGQQIAQIPLDSVALMGILADRFPVGTRVRFTNEADRFPHFLVHTGETGVVTEADKDTFAVKLDEVHEGAAEWDNAVIWTPDDFECWTSNEPQIEVID